MESKMKVRVKRLLRKAGVMKRHPSQVLAPKGCPRFDCSRVVWQPDNHLVYRRHLQNGSVQYDPSDECWVVLGFEDVLQVLKRDHDFGNAYTAEFDAVIGGTDGEEHDRLRRSMKSSIVIDKQEAREFVEDWMERFLERRRRFDAVADLGVRLPRDFTSDLLGLRPGELESIVNVLASRRTNIDSCLDAVTKVMHRIVADVKVTPRTGLIGDLVHSDIHRGLSDEQIVSVARHIWFAGTVTLSTALPACLLWLCREPETAERLRSNPLLLGSFFSEVLRLESPTQFLRRKCLTDLEFGGRAFLKGAMVRPCLASANRDPSAHPEPDRLILDRPPYRHLAFGFGDHVCLGALQAKTIAETAVHVILKASPSIRSLTPVNALEYEKSPLFRGLKRLEVSLD